MGIENMRFVALDLGVSKVLCGEIILQLLKMCCRRTQPGVLMTRQLLTSFIAKLEFEKISVEN